MGVWRERLFHLLGHSPNTQNRVREKKRKIFYHRCIFQMTTNAKSKPRPSSEAPMWTVGAQVLGLFSIGFHRSLTANCVRNGAVGTWTSTHVECQHCNWWFYLLCQNVGPWKAFSQTIYVVCVSVLPWVHLLRFKNDLFCLSETETKKRSPIYWFINAWNI